MSNKFDRRNFLKTAVFGLTGAGLAACTLQDRSNAGFKMSHSQRFNMAGFGAPALETVRIGVIGIGNRGLGGVRRLIRIEGTEITGLCDIETDRVQRSAAELEETSHNPALYSGRQDSWKELCEADDVDLVYICTPWDQHTEQAVHAMEHGKHVAVELPAAKTIEECWQLVETSEKTQKHCMMLGNVCYDFFEMMILNMVRHGFFGELIHGEGAYIHDLMAMHFSEDYYHDLWRLKENSERDGNLYPPHAIGPIAKMMNINCGDQMDYLVSTSSNDFQMANKAREMAAENDLWKPFEGRDFRGNMNTTTIRTKKGRTIMLQHDVTSPRPYSRICLISGTDGIARKWPGPARIAKDHTGWLSEEDVQELEEKYTPEITRRVGDMAREVGGHGGMDTIMDWRLIDCLRNGLPLDMNVYDAALWSAIAPLSEWSVANRSTSVDVPDFTGGAWETNEPGMDINLESGGTTQII
ncbi:MAG: Gfo/Idh/MocA family oxidoreductase [Balneolaceae bacterium]|nr:Gfo/Idh/MocA family oxidoreductase [Balneolaceae bacterium]MCH8548438.1 Gfo/Idh/MocA family oxidoreductase [Balneolaceae bacterium]